MSEATVVTSDNLAEFNAKALRLDIPEPVKEPEAKPEPGKEPEVKAEEEHEEPESPDDKKKNRLSKRMQELANQRRDALERAERAEARLKEFEESRQETKPAEKKATNGKPEPSQFKDDFEYAEALANWTVDQREAAREAERAKSELQKAEEARQKTWQKRQQEYAKEVADYQDVMASIPDTVKMHQVVLDAITDSEMGPQVLYHIASNPEIAESWNDLSPVMALRALGKLEGQLEKAKEPKPIEVKKEVSKAPPPITPVEGKTTPDNLVSSDGEFKGTYAQFKALRESGKIK